jgi:CubicO group peptidase (beta-lactamase class C family)
MNLEYLPRRKFLLVACVLVVLTLQCACGRSATAVESPPPSYVYSKPAEIADGWMTASATDLGVDAALLEQMMNVLATRFDIVDSIAIAYQGKLILDETVRTELNTFDGWVSNTDLNTHVLFSASKSVASLAIGIAIDQGIFSSVDVPFLEQFDYAGYENWDDRKNEISLEDVLTMRMGLAWNEWDPPYTSPDNQMLRFYETETDFSKSLLDLPMAADPGTTFAYSTPAIVSLGQAIENRGPLTLIDFGFVYALAPLNISSVEVLRTPTGLPDLGRGLFLSARDFLKFGQLYANGGVWNGTRIVSESWIAASVVAHTSLSWSDPATYDWQLTGYGYQWWLGYFEYKGQRIDAYAARGHGEQNLIVMPAIGLVVAVFSHAFESKSNEVNQVFEMIADFIIPALPMP